MTSPKILIVEDQGLTLESLEFVVNKVMPRFYPDFQRKQYDVARCYRDARDKIIDNTYGIIILDHRMPMNDPGEMESIDFKVFSESLVNIGYSLIPGLREKHPETVIIGTSSLSGEDLGIFQQPDYKMSKMWGEAEKDLENILRQVNGGRQ